MPNSTLPFADMTVREYFAAHAPVDPQHWFTPFTPPMPKAPSDQPAFADDFPERAEDRNFIINLCWNWRRDPCYDLSTYVIDPADTPSREHSNALLAHARPFLVDYETAWNDYRHARAAWESNYEKQRLIQWPFAWADAVLGVGEVNRG